MKTLAKILFEMIPVVLGILIALFINNRKESTDNQRFVNKTLNYIEQELQNNQEGITRILKQQRALVDTVNLYVDNDKISVLETILKTKGFKTTYISNTSWKSFLNTKLELIDFDIISQLSTLEERKRSLEVKMNKLIDFVYENAESKLPSKKEFLSLLIDDIIGAQEDILDNQERFFKLLEK